VQLSRHANESLFGVLGDTWPWPSRRVTGIVAGACSILSQLRQGNALLCLLVVV
jgi:hypothetical protein